MTLRLFWEGLCEATPWEQVLIGWAFCNLCICIWNMCQDDRKE